MTVTHRESATRLYVVWASMKKRCHNPKSRSFRNYGGRGIRVCDEWQRYEPFRDWALANGYDPDAPRGHTTLDRIDNDADYSPSNCRFATQSEQMRNVRYNRYITAFGETKTLAGWADDPRCPVNVMVLWKRLARGWSTESAITGAPYTRKWVAA